MTRAEDAALKAYESDIYVGGESCRRAYKEGYEQAEKDLALTWQDIKTIVKLADDLVLDDTVTDTEEGYYEAVLKAFIQTKNSL